MVGRRPRAPALRFLAALALIESAASFLPTSHVGRVICGKGLGLASSARRFSPSLARTRMMSSVARPSKKDALEIIKSTEMLLRNPKKSFIPAMDALFTPCKTEQLTPIEVNYDSKSLPADMPAGCLVRLGPNPRPGDDCPAYFDGDGMVHVVTVPPADQRQDEKMWYSRAWVRTRGFAKEEEIGGKTVMQGTLVAPKGWPILTAMVNNVLKTGILLKDTANTAISAHGGKILARMEQALPSEIAISRKGKVRTVSGGTDLGGSIPYDPLTGGSLGAHTKEDTDTGELMCFTYDSSLPRARYDVRSASGGLTHTAYINLPQSVMVHDLAITKSYSLLLDLPLTINPLRIFANIFPVAYDGDAGARIGLVPRKGGDDDTVWVDVEPCVVLHTINAYDDDNGNVVLTAMRCMPSGPFSFMSDFTPAFPYEWVLDPKTKTCISERYLSTDPSEFPAVHPEYVGKKARFGYGIKPIAVEGPLTTYEAPCESVLYHRLVRYDLESGAVSDESIVPQDTYFISEPTIVPKVGASAEDDAYVLAFTSSVQEEGGGATVRSKDGTKVLVYDAKDMGKGPVCEIPVPNDMPYGLHSHWVPWEMLEE